MPFYYELTLRDSDSAAVKAKKQRVAKKIRALRAALAQHIQGARTNQDGGSRAIRIATWNLREFGGTKYGGRDFEPLYYIAEIISHFHLVAVQEVRGDLKELRQLLGILGPDWDYLATDVTDGNAGNGERMCFVFDRNFVRFNHIAGELTLPEMGKVTAAFGERLLLNDGFELTLPPGFTISGDFKASLKTVSGKKKLAADLEIPLADGGTLSLPAGTSLVIAKNTEVGSPGAGRATVNINSPVGANPSYRLRLPNGSFDDSFRQFARTPYLISFQSGWLKLNLCTVHIYYGDNDDPLLMQQRKDEIALLTKALAAKAKDEFKHDKNSFLGVLGDFNIIGKDHPTMAALQSNSFEVPAALQHIPGSNVAKDKAYDQIAFWMDGVKSSTYARLDIQAAGVFDYFEHVYKLEEAATYPDAKNFKDWRTYKMSDHLPMWIELRNDFGNEYLQSIEGAP